MKSARDVLQAKGCEIWSIAPGDSVLDALTLMADKNVGAVLVLSGGTLFGIMSERDYARKVELSGKTAKDTRIWEIMTHRVICVRADQSIGECMALMTNQRIRHLPVVDGQQLVGLISIGDVVQAIISDQELMIEQLESYIWGETSWRPGQ